MRATLFESPQTQQVIANDIPTIRTEKFVSAARSTTSATGYSPVMTCDALCTKTAKRRRQGTRCVTVDVSQSERDALVVRGYLAEEERDSGAALKRAIEAVLSDIELNLQYETAERNRTRV